MDKIYNSAKQFEQALEQAVEDFEIDASVTIRKSLVDLTAKVIQDTPRDTGRAAAGWNLTGEQPSNEVPPKGQESYTVESPQDPGDAANWVWYLVNNVEYISVLEDGYSDQAANGFLAVNLSNFARILNKYAGQSEYFE